MNNEKGMRLWYDKEPPKSMAAEERYPGGENLWERWSLPLGNGYLGACVFGYADTERIQITENSLSNPYRSGVDLAGKTSGAGLNSFAEIYIDFSHGAVTDYERELSLDDAAAKVRYVSCGVKYSREYFASYPDKALVMRFFADKCGGVSLFARVEVPHLRPFGEVSDGYGKRAEVFSEGDTVTMRGEMEFYGISFEGQLRVIAKGGATVAEGGGIRVSDADEVVMIFACATNYKMESRVFTERDPKKKLSPYPHPHKEVCERIALACAKSCSELFARHKEDYQKYFGRVKLNIGECGFDVPTDILLSQYAEGKESRYLEALLYQYGRYLLIASSRRGCLPANLQGIWNAYNQAPWSAGYWHNINLQMNYWPSCIANLSEMFLSYSDYNQAYMAAAKENADVSVKLLYEKNYTAPGTNGWIIGTGAWPYRIEGFEEIKHSGPGTGAITSLLFWEYYDYTRDEDFLREIAYPVLRDMSIFLSKALVERERKLLISPSASPENMKDGKYYHTEGCAFDQQMVYENHKRTVEAARILGIDDDPVIKVFEAQLDRLDPVLVGKSGQVKEYREEEYYGDIGEYTHRHISQLFGLYPGTLINSSTEEWLRAAVVTLTERGDKSTGWAAAHRLCLWARAKSGKKAMDLVRSMLCNNILPNLWDTHPPFQIDGNFGYTAGVSEMLLQSAAGYIELLAALPDEWAEGSFSGLVARGNFTVGCEWKNKKPTRITVYSSVGGELKIRESRADSARVLLNGKPCGNAVAVDGFIRIITSKGNNVELTFH